MTPQRRATILIVDAEPANRALMRAYLESEFAVLEAAEGARALELVRDESVDLMLLDVMMPGINGFDVCRTIKSRDAAAYLPVILLTALGRQDDRNAGLEAGADDFLTKPVDRHELILRMR